jgi:polar amino acid transport system substrate-binding protein
MTSSTRRGLSRLSAMLATPFVAASAAQAQTAPQGTIDRIKARGTFLAGVRYDFPPVGSLDTAGRPTGFGPDLAKAFADKLGVRVEYVQITSRNRFALLQNNGIDADIGPTTPTVQREDVVDFSTPYVWDSCVLIVKKGTSGNVADYGPPRRIATTQGSLLVDYVKSEVPTAQFVFFQEYPDAITALLAGRVDAVATNTFSAQSYVALRPQLLEVGTPFYNDPWAIGIRENDSKWRNFLDITMQEMWHRGEYQTMFARHFGAPPVFKMWSEYRLQPGIGA